MFEDALMENRVKDTSRWSVVLSTALQLFLVGVMLLIPLLNYYELPATDFVSFLTAPPPPPPPPAAARSCGEDQGCAEGV